MIRIHRIPCKALLAAACLICGGAIALPPAMAAETLGRLFLTPEQRDRLESRRQSKVSEVVAAQSTTPEADEPVASYLNFQGQIVRSSGAQTIFINGTPYSGRDAPRGTQLGSGKRLGEIVVVPAEGAQRVPLKVGQSLDKNSLAVDDALARSGTITVDKPAARAGAATKAAR
jgi:hypothetical protein